MLAMYTKGITLTLGRADSRRYLPDILRLARTRRFDPLQIQTNVVPLAEGAGAWLADPTVKLVLDATT